MTKSALPQAVYYAIDGRIDDETGEVIESGKVECYGHKESHATAVAACLYTHKVHYGNAYIGPSGGVIYCQCGQWIVTRRYEDD